MKFNKVLITGSNGFIGKNLCHNEFINKNYKILKFVKSSNQNKLENFVKNSDLIIHLAGENRPKTKEKFYENNYQLTKNICDILIRNGLNKPVIFTSTIHVKSNDDYGKTKLLAEKELENLSKTNGNPVSIIRLPGVFGKWSKPNYNSVVSTFCYNIANNKTSYISNKNFEVSLIYIDDVIDIICNIIKKKQKSCHIINCNKNIHKIKLGQLYSKIEKFNQARINLDPINIVRGFNKKLYATFITYLPSSKITYKLFEHEDKRGKFFELFKEKNGSQISLFTSNTGFKRGGHYHNTKVEKFLVISGKANFIFKDINTNKKFEFILEENDYKIVESLPGYWHEIDNLAEKELKVLVWSNEVFNKKKDDTYR